MALLQCALRRAAASAMRPAPACSSSLLPLRLESTDAVVQKAKENEGNVITTPGQAYLGDLRATSGLGLGDGIENHTDKWKQGPGKTPMEYIQQTAPIEVHGLVVASRGSDDPALGAPVEYIDLRGTTPERPAVCKYTGNKYYSLDWKTPSKAGH